MTARWIIGQVHFQSLPQESSTNYQGVLRVQLLDTSHADARSIVLAEVTITNPIARLQRGTELEFRIPWPENLSPGSSLSLRAHLDHDASGLVEVGDQITVQNYPVALDQIDCFHHLELKTVEA